MLRSLARLSHGKFVFRTEASSETNDVIAANPNIWRNGQQVSGIAAAGRVDPVKHLQHLISQKFPAAVTKVNLIEHISGTPEADLRIVSTDFEGYGMTKRQNMVYMHLQDMIGRNSLIREVTYLACHTPEEAASSFQGIHQDS